MISEWTNAGSSQVVNAVPEWPCSAAPGAWECTVPSSTSINLSEKPARVSTHRCPGSVAQADFDALTAAGWSEDGINGIIFITGIYAMMNRLLEGSGIKENVPPPGFSPEKARAGRYSLPRLTGH